MTSLAEQLKQLAAPQTSLLVHTKKKASFLFDPKYAAELDRDTLYELGTSGLSELKSINQIFEFFQTSLFDEESRKFERAVETRQTNSKLDQQINKFLIFLSPYYPLKCTHKALEWLITRYHIEEYNIDAIMMLILPYHETNIFARMVQILSLKKEADRWFWLKSIQKKGVPLAKHLLLTKAASDISFFKFVCNMPLQAIQVHGSKSDCLSTLFAFYATTVIGALEQTPQVSELHVTHLLPSIMAGLNSPYIDFTAGVYMILAHLTAKIRLTSRLLQELFQKISQSKQPRLHSETMMLLVALCQSCEGKDIITMQAVRQLAALPWFIPTVANLAETDVVVFPLISAVIITSMKSLKSSVISQPVQEAVSEIVKNILDNIKLDAVEVDRLFSIMIEEDVLEREKNTFCYNWHHKILRELEKKYPDSFDKAVSNKPELLSFVPNHTPQAELFERLNHCHPEVRAKAVQFVLSNFNELQDTSVKGSLGDLLNDDSPVVLDAVLRTPPAIFRTLLPTEELVNKLVHIVVKAWRDDKYSALAAQAVQQFSGLNPDSTLFLLVVFPYLLPGNIAELETAKVILSSSMAKKVEFIKALKHLKSHTQPDHVYKDVCERIVKSESVLPQPEEILSVLDEYCGESCALVFVAAVLASTRTKAGDTQPIMQLLRRYMTSPKLKYIKSDNTHMALDEVLALRTYCKGDVLPLQGALYILTSVMTNTGMFPDMGAFWENTCPTVTLYVEIFKVILLGLNSQKKKIRNAYLPCKDLFFKSYFANIQAQTGFLANIVLNTPDIASDCLSIMYDFIEQHSKDDVTWAVETSASNVMIPVLLITLSSEDVNTRTAALSLLSMLMQKLAAPKRSAYLKLLHELSVCKEEITLDNEQVNLQLYTLLSPDPAVRTLHDKSLQKLMSEALSELMTVITAPSTPVHVCAALLKLIAQITSPSIVEQLIPLGIQILVSAQKDLMKDKASILLSIIRHVNNSTVQCFSTSNAVFWQFAQLCLEDHSTQLQVDVDRTECPAVLFLNQITRELFMDLDKSIQIHLLNIIVKSIAETENGDVSSAAASFVKRIVLNSAVIMPLLVQMKDVTIKEPVISKPKRLLRAKGPPPLQLLTTAEWKQGVCLLELIQNKKKLQNIQLLLPLLFGILNKCLEFEEQAPVEYTKQLLLSSILHSCQKLSPDGQPVEVSENLIQVELIVQCIRASHNPQTHHHALLVLTHTAAMIPEQVLHNVMAIFTFMGSSVLRQDDAYSFQIISKIVETIIPVLIQRVKEGDELTGAVAEVLRVFVTALLDIPEHRRLPLLTKLLNTLAQGQFLWVFLCLVFESNVLHPMPNQSSGKEVGSMPKRLEIALQLCFQFTPLVLLTTCHQLIKYVSCLPPDKDDKRVNAFKGTSLSALFDVQRNTNKQLHHYMYTLLTFLSSLLSSVHFVSKIASLTEEETNNLEEIFKSLVESILTYIQALSKLADKSVNTPSAKYWRVMLNQCFDVLDKTNALLPSDMFLSVIRSLISHPLPILRRKALDLLNWRLQQSRPLNSEILLTLLPNLLDIIKSISADETQEVQLTQQTSLISIKLLARQLASENPAAFKEILVLVTHLVKSSDAAEPVLASVVLCLGELCCTMRAHTISALPKFMPPLIKLLHKDQLTDNNDIMLLSVVSAVHKIVESLPHFLSPYLDALIFEVVLLTAMCQKYSDNLKLQPIVQKLKFIRQKLSGETPLRVLLPAVSNCYSKLIAKKRFSGVAPLMSLLADSFSSGTDLTPDVSQFLLNALDFRSKSSSTEDVTVVEPPVINTTIALILKLSESSFRQFYFKIYEWAFRSDDNKDRAITFYKLTSSIAECLKGLFVLFVNYFIMNAATLLDENNLSKSDETSFGIGEDSEAKAVELVDAILKTLHTVFLYDANHFINRERFDRIMQPIVDQLENGLGGDAVMKSRCETLVTPCLSQMAVSSGDDSLWKQLNYQILLKTRHNLSQVRLAGLLTACEVAKKLGEEFLPLLPETVPFLAELLEDENEEVEKTCHHVVQDLETVLGEPIHKYF